jgi:CDP-glycerol glycerophosphotransferase (TagB/SpsB family)
MARWYFSARRYVPSTLERRMRAECSALVLSNIQISGAGRFLTAARRLRIPVVGYVASWDHPVGKGVMSPHLDRYVVQNEIMRRDLARLHGIEGDHVITTGWPQSDVFHAPRSREAFEALLARYGLEGSLPVVLVTGNSAINAPYEGRFVERLVGWWREEARGRVRLLFRPHPRDTQWRERYAGALATAGVGVQPASYTDMDDLATLLHHVAVVVTNAGTILLDALANDRPAVCVVYDEGAPPGEEWAAKNILGEHYRELLDGQAFPQARSFEQVVAEIEMALADPGARREERARVAVDVLGVVDGQAADRVVQAIVGGAP